MECQLQCFDDAAEELTFRDKLPMVAKKFWTRFLRKLTGATSSYYVETDSPRSVYPPLNLKAGEKVRVRSLDEIRLTLNDDNKFQGLKFFLPMEQYCGKTLTVRKKVNKIFNERSWKMSKIRNVVLLEGAFCDGQLVAEKEMHGCDRLCFLWWKEAWLERVTDDKDEEKNE